MGCNKAKEGETGAGSDQLPGLDSELGLINWIMLAKHGEGGSSIWSSGFKRSWAGPG